MCEIIEWHGFLFQFSINTTEKVYFLIQKVHSTWNSYPEIRNTLHYVKKHALCKCLGQDSLFL